MSEEMQETGGGTVEIDDETGKSYWSLWGEGWKDGEDMAIGEVMELSPDSFPPGTRIVVIEPDMDSKVSQEFYRKIQESR